jgi:hypothetical protein
MLSNTLIGFNSELDSIIIKKVDNKIYISEVLVKKDPVSSKYRSWGFFIESEVSINLENKEFEFDCYLKTFYGMLDSLKYPTISKGKLITKALIGSNNQITRAIKLGLGEMKKKQKLGFTTVTKVDNETSLAAVFENINLAPVPEQYKSKGTPDFPLYAGIKYDGVSLVCCYHPTIKMPYNVICYTRSRQLAVGFLDIRKEIKRLFINKPGLFIVGEIYKHGMKRNEINSIHSRNVKGSLETCDLNFYVFDCFYAFSKKLEGNISVENLISDFNKVVHFRNMAYIGLTMSLEDKISKIEAENSLIEKGVNEAQKIAEHYKDVYPLDLLYTERQDLIKHIDGDFIKLARVYEPTSLNELNELYNDISQEFEGLIIRKNVTYMYSFGTKKINPSSFKMKPFEEDEFEISGYTTGKGKASKDIIFILKISNGKFFNVTMNINSEEMIDLYADVTKNEDNYIGRKLTVRYEKLSPYGVPIQAKGITIRNDIL